MSIITLTIILFAVILVNSQFNGHNPGSRSLDVSKQAKILRYDNENDGLGNYRFSYETSDGSKRSETGEYRELGPEDGILTVQGSYSYIADDGQVYSVRYIADENGFKVLPPLPLGPFAAPVPAVGVGGNVLNSLIGGGLR